MVLFEKKSEGPVYECIILPDKTVLAVFSTGHHQTSVFGFISSSEYLYFRSPQLVTRPPSLHGLLSVCLCGSV